MTLKETLEKRRNLEKEFGEKGDLIYNHGNYIFEPPAKIEMF